MGVALREKAALQDDNGLQDVPCSETATVSLSSTSAGKDEPDEPSKEELETLRRVGSKVPNSAWLVAMFSGSERFAFYALQSPLRNQPRTLTIRTMTDP